MDYIVNAYHVSAKYQAINELIKVYQDKGDNRYYADSNLYGCSKNYKTPEDAIYSMLSDHGCYAITIEKVK
jgi:hypothetical protein